MGGRARLRRLPVRLVQAPGDDLPWCRCLPGCWWCVFGGGGGRGCRSAALLVHDRFCPVPSFFGPEGLDTEGIRGRWSGSRLVRPVSGRGPPWGGMTRTDRGAGAAEVPDPGRGEARGPKSPAAPNAGRRSRRGAAARSVIAARCNGFRRVRVGRRAGCGVDGRAAAGWSGQRRDAVDGEVQAVKLGASDIDHLSNTQAWSSTSGPVGELSEARAMSFRTSFIPSAGWKAGRISLGIPR